MKIEEISDCIRPFGIKINLSKTKLYHFDSIVQFKEYNSKMKEYDKFILKDITIKRKTGEPITISSPISLPKEGIKYHFLLEDRTGNFSAALYNHPRMAFPPDCKTWEDAVNAREGDIIDGAFAYFAENSPLILELTNKTIDSKV